MTLYAVGDLTPIEQTYLGVLSVGLVPFELAHEPRFRMEYLCAVCHALMQHLPRATFVEEDYFAKPAIREDLRLAMVDLDEKGIIGVGPPQDVVLLTPAPERVERAFASIDVNKHPPLFDKFLAQRCMDLLFDEPSVHAYLIELYGESSEIWGKLYEQGYGQYR